MGKDVEELKATAEGRDTITRIRTEALAAAAMHIPALQAAAKPLEPFNVKYHEQMQRHLIKEAQDAYLSNLLRATEHAASQNMTTEKYQQLTEAAYKKEVEKINKAKPNDFDLVATVMSQDDARQYANAYAKYEQAKSPVLTAMGKVFDKHGLDATINNLEFRDEIIAKAAFPKTTKEPLQGRPQTPAAAPQQAKGRD